MIARRATNYQAWQVVNTAQGKGGCDAVLHGADLRGANLHGADLTGADLTGADLRDAILKGATVTRATFSAAELGGADLAELEGWETLGSVSCAQVTGVRHAPAGWREWMLARGASEGDQFEELPASDPTFSQEWRTV